MQLLVETLAREAGGVQGVARVLGGSGEGKSKSSAGAADTQSPPNPTHQRLFDCAATTFHSVMFLLLVI